MSLGAESTSSATAWTLPQLDTRSTGHWLTFFFCECNALRVALTTIALLALTPTAVTPCWNSPMAEKNTSDCPANYCPASWKSPMAEQSTRYCPANYCPASSSSPMAEKSSPTTGTFGLSWLRVPTPRSCHVVAFRAE